MAFRLHKPITEHHRFLRQNALSTSTQAKARYMPFPPRKSWFLERFRLPAPQCGSQGKTRERQFNYIEGGGISIFKCKSD